MTPEDEARMIEKFERLVKAHEQLANAVTLLAGIEKAKLIGPPGPG